MIDFEQLARNGGEVKIDSLHQIDLCDRPHQLIGRYRWLLYILKNYSDVKECIKFAEKWDYIDPRAWNFFSRAGGRKWGGR